MNPEPLEYESDLVDTANLSFESVVTADHPVLANALRRLHLEADHPGEVLAGFQSAF